MMSKKSMMRNGILAGLATMFLAFGVGCGDDEPESRCGENEAYLLIGAGPAQCYERCEIGEDEVDPCGDGFACRTVGADTVCRETSGPNPDPDPDACDAQVVCESYCEARFGACIDEQCGGDADVRAQELDWCLNGQILADQNGQQIEISQGCLAEAEASQVACEQFEAQAAQLETAGCEGDAGKAFVCSELAVYNSTAGAAVYSGACGCEPAPVAGACTENVDCSGSVYDGFCITTEQEPSAPEAGFCIAQCDASGLQPGRVRNDINCGGENGLCVNNPEFGGGICDLGCLEIEDCPSTPANGVACAPTLSAELEDGSILSFGTCTIASCNPEAEVTGCEENTPQDGAAAATFCHPFGFCTQPCEVTEEDPTGGCSAPTTCDEERGFCEFPWADSM